MTLAPGNYTFTWPQGATLEWEFQLSTAGGFLDISGWTGRAEVRNKVADDPTSIIIVPNTATRVIITDGPNGKFKLQFTEAEGVSVNSQTYTQFYCDPELIEPTGEVRKYIRLTFNMLAEYTR